MADGSALAYSALFPVGSGPFPTLMSYNGYDAGGIGGWSYRRGSTAMSHDLDTALLEHGYALVGVNMRGTGPSDGDFELFQSQWGPDGAAAVQWISEQPWSTGRIGMYNWSWGGIGQLCTAGQRPQALAAIAPGMVVVDPLRDSGSPGGVPNNFAQTWWRYIQLTWGYAATSAIVDRDWPAAKTILRRIARTGPDSPGVVTRAHRTEDAYTLAHSLTDAVGRITAPTLAINAWQDMSTGPRPGSFAELLPAETTWSIGTNGKHDIYVSASIRAELLRFFDHYVKGEENGFEATPHARIWFDTAADGPDTGHYGFGEMNRKGNGSTVPGFVYDVPATDQSDDQVWTLNLRRDGALSSAVADPGEPASAYQELPRAPKVDLFNFHDGWRRSTPPASTLAYSTAPFEDDHLVFGPASLDLHVSVDDSDADLQVILTHVDPEGNETYVQSGLLRLSNRALDPEQSTLLEPFLQHTTPQPVRPGHLVACRVPIPAFAHAFRRGSALRIWLYRPSAMGVWKFDANPAQGRLRIHHDAATPSLLRLRRTPYDIPTAAPAPGSLWNAPSRPGRV
ncbi:CocE/NonD family hydrolase [Gordonia hydrophobica]|uniref:CocE/NonD family hydrolase n=1 Tax=Gordonia hydrophobica TaxID=40516 RepID=A0ABZ2TXZ0_9ACTN|nr:CocE/NonD family hydrolase [Gordonia hydrophobica]MBM7366549.1 putative acyl esterase [Gordonia hydrophobica]